MIDLLNQAIGLLIYAPDEAVCRHDPLQRGPAREVPSPDAGGPHQISAVGAPESRGN